MMPPTYTIDDDDDDLLAAPSSPRGPPIPPTPPPPPAGVSLGPPPAMPTFDPATGAFHPDFMFCGECTTCQEPHDTSSSTDPNAVSDYNTHPDEIDNNLEAYFTEEDLRQNRKNELMKSTFQLLHPIQNKHVLVIQSMLQPLPGVSKVVLLQKEHQVVVDHAAQTSTGTILSSLDSVGYKAICLVDQASPDGDEPTWVRSTFFVQGICCASEVPSIRKIVKPLTGVSKLQINITTKMVYVQHDMTRIDAEMIARELDKEGFPAQIKSDGAKAVAVKNQALNYARSTLHIEGQLTEHDIGPIQQRLSRIPGVSKIGVNISEGVVYVDHDVERVRGLQCADQLQPDYKATVVTAGEETFGQAATLALDEIGKSKYVESTIVIDGLDILNVKTLEKAVAQNFIRAQVRAIYPNLTSHTVKVEHNPKLISILDICQTLDTYQLPPSVVVVNGADSNLWLPLVEDYGNEEDEKGTFGYLHANVVLSGIFWVLSIISLRGGAWERLEYFGVISVIFGLPPIALKAFRTVKRCEFDSNCMMVTSSIGALILREYDEAASVAFLFAVSEFLEARASQKARKALAAIVNLRPDHANVIHPVTKEVIVVPADRVPLGSLLSVKTGDKIACDGVVVEGTSAVDESSLTGESRPAPKGVNDTVSGGTINVGQTQLVVRTTTTTEDSAVSRLIRLVEEAQANRSPTEKMIDTLSRSYTPFVMAGAVVMCTIPWLWGREAGRYWMLNGLIIIVIACPCALTISTPVTYAAGLAATAQRGIIVKGGAKLEALGSVDKIVFDKTGTLTQGKFTVMNLEVVGNVKTRKEMLELLTLLQERSSHPLSASLVDAAKKEGIYAPNNVRMESHTILKGEGVTAVVDGKNVYVGNKRLFERLGMYEKLDMHMKELVLNWVATVGSVGFIGTDDDGIIGAFCLKDAVREDARAVIKGFKNAGIETIMATGDSSVPALAVAREIGMPRAAVHAQLLPEDKLHFVGSLKRPQPKTLVVCREKKYVLFCGDGVNDAPALAVADVGVSMGEGASMAMEMSDITLMDSNLSKLSYAIKMGRRVLQTVKENIFLSFASKFAVVGLTFAGKMTLLTAIAADVGIMLIVTLNGMKLLPSRQFDPSTFNQITNLEKKTKKGKGDYEMTPLSSPSNQVQAPPEIV